MAKYDGKTIENLTPTEALNRGYFMPEQARVSNEWIEAKIEIRHSDTIVYVNGVYKGVAKSTTPLFKIVEKFKL